uniref:Uncharacterized protein n=1 Tax=Anguilla anguilla TaxID=7936 RepID=A0A0E9TIR4_ANGAN
MVLISIPQMERGEKKILPNRVT